MSLVFWQLMFSSAYPDTGSAVLPTAAQATTEIWLAVVLNGEDTHETALLLRDERRRLLASATDIERWRLRLPSEPALRYQGESYYALDDIGGLSHRVDESAQQLVIDANSDRFRATTLSGAAQSPTAVASAFGAFLNYDGFAQYVGGNGRFDTLAELGVFHAWGVGTLNMRGEDLGGTTRFTRLDTTWISDMPSCMASLRLGDTISRPGDWGGSVLFGGIQWGTNFATQARFVSFPLPAFSGESALPSTFDLYVNNALRLRREVPAGPFSITDLPVVTGLGESRLVVKDLLGREQIVTQSYYVTPRLLSAGLHDYSYEIGFTRRNFGLSSFDYGRFFASGTHRFGFSERFTGEAHGEFLREQQTAGVNGSWLWPELGVFGLSVAGSYRGSEPGGLVAFGFERQAQWLGIGGRIQLSSEHFTRIGLETGRPAPRQTGQVYASLSSGAYGSFNFGYTRLDNRDGPDISLVSAGYNVSLGSLGYLNLSFFRSLEGDPNPSFALTLTRALGERGSASLGGTLQRNNDQATLQAQQNLPRGSGYGYRLLASAGSHEQLQAGFSMQNDVGLYTVDAAHFAGDTGVRGSVSGGVALMGGQPFFSRRLSDSFALVQVPDRPGVRVYADNQAVGRTDAGGNALIPQLRAYDRNRIRIEQADLPLDVQIDSVERDAVPYFRSGYLLQFPVRRARGGLFRIVLTTGEPMPAGAMVRILGQETEFPVALKGEVFVTGLDKNNRLLATWRGQSCEMVVDFQDQGEPLPDLGSFTCRGVKP